MKVLEVVKMFLWRVGNNILPTRKNLFNKKIVENPCCPICQNMEETIIQVLWNFPTTNDLWFVDKVQCRNGTMLKKTSWSYGRI